MNRIFVSVVMCFCTLALQAQTVKEKDVPSVVVKKLQELYPGIRGIKWEMEDGMYEATFKNEKTETSVLLSREALLAVIETEIKPSELPEGIQQALAKDHPSKSVKEAFRITDAKGLVTYEVEIADTEYIFSSEGTLLETED